MGIKTPIHKIDFVPTAADPIIDYPESDRAIRDDIKIIDVPTPIHLESNRRSEVEPMVSKDVIDLQIVDESIRPDVSADLYKSEPLNIVQFENNSAELPALMVEAPEYTDTEIAVADEISTVAIPQELVVEDPEIVAELPDVYIKVPKDNIEPPIIEAPLYIPEALLSIESCISYPELPSDDTLIRSNIINALYEPDTGLDDGITNELLTSFTQLEMEQSHEVIEICIEIEAYMQIIAEHEDVTDNITPELLDKIEELYDLLAKKLNIDISDATKRECFIQSINTVVLNAIPFEYRATIADRGTHESLADDHVRFKNAAYHLLSAGKPLHNWLGRYTIRLATV